MRCCCVCVLSHSRAVILPHIYWNTFFISNSDYFVISLVITVRAALYIITAAHWLSTDAHMEFKQYIKVQFLHFYQKQRSASSQWKQSSWILACVWVCCVLSSTMVQWQLCTLENLMYSGFGRPFPRHGLQLLFWFSNQCVTCEVVQLVVTMKVRSGLCVSVCVWIRLTPDVFPQLVSDCQPENGNFGFHLFGNMEELLPVLSRPRKSRSKVCHVCLVVSQVEISLLPVRGTAQLVMVQWKHFSLRFQALSWNLNGQTCHYKWNEKKGKGGSVQVGVGLRL